MNKIYKVIYSKVRNCYIVVSELAKSHDSAHGTRSRSGCCRKAAVLAAFVLTTSLAAVPVWAQAATATNSGNPTAGHAVNIEMNESTSDTTDNSGTLAQGSGAYATYDSEGNLIMGKDNEVVPIQKDPRTDNARVDSKPENVVMGTRNGVGKFTHSKETKKPVSGDDSYAYQKLDTEWITVKVYNLNTNTYDDKQVEVYKLTPGQYMDDEYNVRAKHPERSKYNSDEDYKKAVEVYNNVATYYSQDATRQSYYVSGATAVGVDNVAEGDRSTAIGNKAKVLNSVSSYYVDAYGKLTSNQADARYWLDKDGNITSNREGYYASDGTFVDRYYMVPRLIDSTDAVAIGSDVTAEGRSAVAIGHQSYAKEYSVAIGENSVTDYMGVAIGKDNKAKYASTAIGHDNDANGYYTATMGVNNTAHGDYSSAIGYQNTVDAIQTGSSERKAYQSHALGSYNTIKGDYNLAAGDNNSIDKISGMAVGVGNKISMDHNPGNSTPINLDNQSGDYSIAVGLGNKSEKNALVIGKYSSALHDGSIAIGNSVNSNENNNNGANDSIAIGTGSKAMTQDSIAFGHGATIGNNNSQGLNGAIAIGKGADAENSQSLAIGYEAYTGNNRDVATNKDGSIIAIGTNAQAMAGYDIAIGAKASTASSKTSNSGGSAVAIGYNAVINDGAQRSVAMGANASVALNVQDAVALGSQSYADRAANNQGGYDPVSNNNSYNAGSNPVWNSTLAAVSVGSTARWDGTKNVSQQTRQITNVAAGKEDTDAVNVAQLKQVVNLVHNGGGGGTGGSGVHDYSVKSVNSGTDTNYNNGGASGDNALAAGVSASATGAHSVAVGNGATAKGQDSIALGTGAVADGIGATAIGQYNTASGQNSLAFGEKSTASGESSTAFGIGSTAAAKNSLAALGGKVAESAKNAVAIGNGAQANLADSVALGSGSVASRARYRDLTDEEKKAVYIKGDSTGSAWEATDNAIAVGNDSKVTRQITGVAAGSLDTDAVNVAQLKKMAADGLKFHGDSGDIVTRKLNTQLDVLGGQTDTNKLTATTDGNIGVVSTKAADETSNGKLEIRLAKELKGLTSVQTGDTTVNDGGLTINKAGNGGTDSITINKTTVSLAGNQITNMGSGIDGTKYTDAGDNNGANIGDVKKLADSRKTTVKSTDGSVKVTNTSTDSTHFDYDLAVDTTKVAGAVDLKYKGDNNTQGSNKLSEAVTFSGTANQIVTKAENGKVTFKLADDLTTQTITVAGKDGKDGQPGTPGHIGIDGKDGQSGIGIDGKDGISIKGQNGKDGVTIKGIDGKDGVDGAEGHIGLNGKDGMVDIWTKPGKPGVDGKDGETMTRIVYQGKDGKEHQGATLDDGLKFHGDSGDIVTRKLNTQLDVLGGQTDTNKLTATTDGNIGVVSTKAADETSNGKLEIRLAKELKGLTSVQTGDTTVNDGGLTINKAGNGGTDSITINKTTVSLAGNQITNMGSGIDGTKYTDAGDNNGANIGDVKKLADSRKTTVKSTDGSVKVTNTSTDSTHFDYDLAVDTTKVAGAVDLKYKGDNNTQGSNKLSEAVTFSGTANQIVTKAENGKVTFKLADDLTTQTITVAGKDGKDGQPGTPGHIGIDGKDGQSGIGIDGKDGISIKGQNGKDGVTIKGIDGKDGVDGAEGHIGLNGKDGMVDIWTKPGKPGVDGKDGETMTRIVYQGKDGKEHQGATLDDGLKFHGDSGDIVTRKLNTQLDVLGGQTDTNKLTATTDGNIGVVSTKAADETSNGKLEIRLAKELKGLTSVQTGDTTVNDGGLTINKAGNGGTDSITINKTTVSLAGNQITNMGSGIDGTKYTDAGDNNGANIGDVKKLADSRKTTVKSTDGSVKVTNTSTDSTHFDYDLSVDTTKVAGSVDLKYKGDNDTQGSNKLSDAVTFSGTANQIVTQAENGKVTFRLADDVTTQTITAVGQNGNDGQIGLTGKNGADGSVTTIIKTVGAKGTDGKDGIPGVDGQPGKDGITRLTYDETDDKGGTEHHVVATLDDGLKFVGNDGNVVTRRLNDTLSIKGGIDDAAVLADKSRVSIRNLGVRQNTAGDGLEIVMTNRPDFEAITVGPDSSGVHKITIGRQDNQNGNPNPAKGNYITGLDNTQWDAGHVVVDRAATEGQLSQAITDISGKEKGGFGLADEKGGTVKKNLGETIAVKGDGKNIETKVNGDALEVSLKKDVVLGDDGSLKAGNTTIDSDGVETNKVKVGDITITNQGINGGAKQITNIASGLDSTKQYTNPGDNNAASIGDVKKIAGEEADKAAEAIKSKSGKNITVKDDHTVNLNDNITLGDETDASKQVSIDGNGAKVTAGDGANKVTVDGSKGQVVIGSGDSVMTLGKQINTAGDSNPENGNYLNGLDNKKWDGKNIQSGRAATEDQLKTVSDKVNSGRVFQGDDGKEVKVGMGDTLKIQGGVKAEDVSQENNIGIVKGADDTLNIRLAKDLKGLNSVTTGNTTINNSGLTVKGDDNHKDITIQQGNVNMGGNTIEGVAPGKISKDSTDAVNGSQLYATNQVISNLGGAVNKLGTRIDRVGAGSAALAALHPLDFDPDDKWDFAAGYGHYRGANAAAVGAYYRPNEDTMFSIGGSFGGGENMFNAGVSIKLGQGNHISTSRVAMAKEIKDLRENVAQLNQIVNRQSALIEKLTSVDTGSIQDKGNDLFPDVPENHWAYEYVTKLAKAGILKGYPDGNFAGDRMMTRYEFAAIVYRAITMGAASDPGLNQDGTLGKLAKEFNQELKFIRIDTIHQTNQGEPTVQRVRVQNTTK